MSLAIPVVALLLTSIAKRCMDLGVKLLLSISAFNIADFVCDVLLAMTELLSHCTDRI